MYVLSGVYVQLGQRNHICIVWMFWVHEVEGAESEVNQLSAEIVLALRYICIERRRIHVVVLVLWSMKYTRASGVRRVSQPDGNGPSCETV
jgi:hypothetical protein